MTSKKQDAFEFPHFNDVFDVDLNPVIGSEIGKRRPALVVSNDIDNRFSATATVLPITSSPVKKLYPFEVSIPAGTAGLSKNSRIKADQIRTIDKKRLAQYRGSLPEEFYQMVQTAIKVHLNMPTP